MHQSTGPTDPGNVHSSRCREGCQADICLWPGARRRTGKLVGRGDFAAQVSQVFANLGRSLAAAGASPKHVAKITIYVVDYQRDYHYPIIERARVTLFGDHKPANVVMGVATLSPDYLIEIDAFAVVDC